MPIGSGFITAADISRFAEHLAKDGTSVVLTMHSGEVKSLRLMDPPTIQGRLDGVTVNGFSVALDPTRIESWSMVHGDLEDLAPAASKDLLDLTIQREGAIASLLDAVDRRDMDAVVTASAGVHEVQDAMRALTDNEPSEMAQDRPGEFGGYEGLQERESLEGDEPADPITTLGEQDGQDSVAGHIERIVLDMPKRRGRPPKHG